MGFKQSIFVTLRLVSKGTMEKGDWENGKNEMRGLVD